MVRTLSLLPIRVRCWIPSLNRILPRLIYWAEIKEALDGYLPYWIKSSRFPFKEQNPEGGVIFNLEQVISGYNGGYSHGGESPVKVAPVPAGVPSNMPRPATESVNLLDEQVKIIPEKMSNYVPFGHFKDVKNIIKSKIFFPVFVTGLSGNGKTLMIEQVCAQLKRELYRVNITIETDEDDLMGGHSLESGNIVFREELCCQSNEKRRMSFFLMKLTWVLTS